MSTLEQLREEVQSVLGFFPDSAAWNKRLNNVINRIYLDVCSTRDWRFLQREYEFTVGPDMEYVATAAGPSLSYTNGSNSVTSSVDITDVSWMTGMTFEDDTLASFDVVFTGALTIKLSADYDGVTGSPKAGALRGYHWYLPDDFEKVLTLAERHRVGLSMDSDFVITGDASDSALGAGVGRIERISASEEEFFLFERKTTGTPEKYRIVQTPRDDLVFNMQEQDEVSLTLQAGGSLTVGTVYKYFVTYKWGEVRSRRSNVVEITTTAGNLTVRISDLTDKAVGVETEFWRAEGNGPFYKLVGTTLNLASQRYDDDGSVAITKTRYTDVDFFVPRLQFWPRPDQVLRFNMTYKCRVPRLVYDEEVPLIPAPHRSYLIHAAVAELSTDPTTKGLHTRLAGQAFDAMEAQYLTADHEDKGIAKYGKARARSVKRRNIGNVSMVD